MMTSSKVNDSSQPVFGSRFAQLALGVATGALGLGYGRNAYGGTCAPAASLGTYLCTGAADATSDITQSFIATPSMPAITITSTPGFGLDTSTSGGAGIDVDHVPAPYSVANNIDITASDITADSTGINVELGFSYLDAPVRIDTRAGRIKSNYAGGIRAVAAGDVTITTADVNSDGTGIYVAPYGGTFPYGGLGNVVIDTTAGTIVSDSAKGIYVATYDLNASGPGPSISITTASVTAANDAVGAYAIFSKPVEIDTTAGTITSTGGDGISYYRNGASSEVTITTADVTGFGTGIITSANTNYGGGTIDSSAGIVIGQTGDGISAIDPDKITVADVYGAQSGIRVVSYAGGHRPFEPTKIIISGTVQGQTGITVTPDRFATPDDFKIIEISSAGLIEGRGGVAVELEDNNDKLMIFDELAGLGSAPVQGIIGDVLFMEGDDLLSFNQTGTGPNILYEGMFTGIFDGGEGIDTATFSVPFSELVGTGGSGDFISLEFVSAARASATLQFLDFELFSFSDAPDVFYTPDQLRGIAAIPLPSASALMLSGLGALALTSRGRAELRFRG